MKTQLAMAFGLAATLLLTSCVVDSDQPLSSPDKARPDPRLVGTWRGKEGDLLTFIPAQGAWMHVKVVGPPKDNEKPGFYDAFPTTIGNDTFLNVRSSGKDDHGNTTTGYFLIRYTITANHLLQMWMMSQDAAMSAVKTGKLKGHIQANGLTLDNPPRPDYDVTLEDTGANLTRFIQDNDATSLFNAPMTPSERVSN